MLISHEHRFIFIKNRKVAGTSVEISLSRFLTHPDDVITPMNPEDEALRLAKTGVTPRNYKKWWSEKFWNHCDARHVRREIGQATFDAYFKFCFERNPWDKAVSWYWFRDDSLKTSPYSDFDDVVARHAMGWSDWNLYTDDDVPIVDFVGQFDRLVPDLADVCARLQLAFDGWLPRAKGGFRADKRPYGAYHDDVSRRIIARAFKREIEAFGYRFAPP